MAPTDRINESADRINESALGSDDGGNDLTRTSRSTSASWNNLRCLLRPWCTSHAAIDPWCAISAARPSTKAPVEAPRSARSCSAVGTPCGAARRAVAGKAATRNPKGADTYGIPSCLVCAAVVAAQSLRQSLQSALVCHSEWMASSTSCLSSRSCYSAPAAVRRLDAVCRLARCGLRLLSSADRSRSELAAAAPAPHHAPRPPDDARSWPAGRGGRGRAPRSAALVF